jgi:hypothetical protein
MNHVQALIAYESAMERARKAATKDQALDIMDAWARAELRDRRVKVDDGLVQKVFDRQEDGQHVGEIADGLDLSTATVRRILRGTGRYARRRRS